MAVLGRISEIGTLMAMGTRQSRILLLFLCEGVVLGLVGGLAGTFFGVLFTMVVAHVGILMPPPPGFVTAWVSEPTVVFGVLVRAFVLSIMAAVLASFFPSLRASRLQVADALRHVS